MAFVAAIALVSGLVPVALAQEPGVTPLASQRFDYNSLPYQADTGNGERGHQTGYNICNSTTEGPESLCQTAIINSIDDFCLWGPPEPDSLIGNTEGEAVAWCTRPGHGTRIIPEGALTGVQWIKTPDYVQVTGFITQDLINIAADDSGGEMDPHGADQRGNPLGGLLFSNAFNGQIQQAVEWHNFMGGGTFCLKACDPAGPNAAHYCEHVFDRIGCLYNAPAAYQDGVFLSCAGANQDFPGVYTDAAGAVQTYQQPPESLGEIQTMPYQPRIPATSECTTYTSSVLYAALNSANPHSASATPSTTRSIAGPGSSTRTRTSSGDATATGGTGAAASRLDFTAVLPASALFGVALLAGFAL